MQAKEAAIVNLLLSLMSHHISTARFVHIVARLDGEGLYEGRDVMRVIAGL